MSQVRGWVRALLGLGALGASAGVLAQTAPQGEGVLGEIVVTAEKREATIQDTPIAVSAFSGDDLAALGISGTDALATFTPGLTIQREVIGKVVIRGIGTENYTVGSDPGVAIHKDGVYLARSSVAIFDFYDTNRVEVLRGPQGTLYGRNATGGVINIVSNRPEKEFGGYARVDVGNYSKRRIEGAVNVPFSDNVQGRLAVLYAQRDGFTENLFPGAPAFALGPGRPSVPALSSARDRDVDQLDNQDLWAARAQLNVGLGDSGSLLLSAEVIRDDSLPPAFKYFNGAPWERPTDLDLPDLRQVSQGFETAIPGTNRTVPSVGRADQDAFTARFEWDFGGMTLTSLTGYRSIDFSWINDGDGFDQFFVTYFQTDESTQLTQEFQLSNSDDGPLQWIVGAYYLNEDAETFTGIPFIIPVPQPAILWDGKSDTDAYAIFGQATYAFTDRLRGTLGLRYNKEEKQGDLVYTLFGGPITPTAAINAPPGTPWSDVLDESWDAFTPKLAVEYDFGDDVMGYGSVTRGFKSGGFNLLAGQAPYDPEYLWAYELGLKTKSAGGRLIANFSAFYYDYSDMQVGKVVNLSATVVNAAKATLYGAEAELRAAPVDNLELNAGLAFLSTEYDEFITEDPGWPGARGCGSLVTAPRTISLAGCELPRAPELQGTAGAQWRIPMAGGGEIRLRGDYSWRSNQYFTQFNRDVVSQDSYGILNARVTYAAPDERWSVTAYADNLSDEDYFVTVLESGVAAPGTVVPQAVVGAPRTYGAVVNFRF
jgi:iron complex outermembrane receptor protein